MTPARAANYDPTQEQPRPRRRRILLAVALPQGVLEPADADASRFAGLNEVKCIPRPEEKPSGMVVLIDPCHSPLAAVKHRDLAAALVSRTLVFQQSLIDTRDVTGDVSRFRPWPRLARFRQAGVHIKAVADLLGHSSIAITGDVYGHASDDTAGAAVDGWSGVLGL